MLYLSVWEELFPVFIIWIFVLFSLFSVPIVRISFYVLTDHLLVELLTLNVTLRGRKPTTSNISFMLCYDIFFIMFLCISIIFNPLLFIFKKTYSAPLTMMQVQKESLQPKRASPTYRFTLHGIHHALHGIFHALHGVRHDTHNVSSLLN